MLDTIDSMSVEEAVEILRLKFQRETKRYANIITKDEWEQMKEDMASRPWSERQRTTSNLDASSRRQWRQLEATDSAIVYRTHLEDYYKWVEVGRTPVTRTLTRVTQEQRPIPPETHVTEYRYADVTELRTFKNRQGNTGLALHCDTKAEGGRRFYVYPDNDVDLDTLISVLIKLCPRIDANKLMTETKR